MRRSASPCRTGGRLLRRRRCAWASGASTPNERVGLAVVAGRCCAVCMTLSITGWSASTSMDGSVSAGRTGRNWVCNVRWRTYRPAGGTRSPTADLGSARQLLKDELAASQAANGTKAAQMASKPSAIAVAAKYARIVSSPCRLDQNVDRATMTLWPGKQLAGYLRPNHSPSLRTLPVVTFRHAGR
jgi:hypothetical protein